jgi:phosphoglycolate phosphatase-like HAD superfamily hydrolase
MHAVIFDIDGTLLDSFEVEGDLFAVAIGKALNIPAIDTDWSSYRHVTDAGILSEILQMHGIGSTPEVLAAVKSEFLTALSAHIDAQGPFSEIPGAVSFVSQLLASPDHYVAYATGAWRESALLKLRSAGFPTDGVCLSTSSEFEDRVSIMRGALAPAPAGIEHITYYGDGTWDQQAVRELGWHFVPVGTKLGGLEHYYDPPRSTSPAASD